MKDSLRLISGGEDLCVKVWDLVLNKEIVSLRNYQARIMCLEFSKDFKTLIVGSKDGMITFYNAQDNFKLIA